MASLVEIAKEFRLKGDVEKAFKLPKLGGKPKKDGFFSDDWGNSWSTPRIPTRAERFNAPFPKKQGALRPVSAGSGLRSMAARDKKNSSVVAARRRMGMKGNVPGSPYVG